MRKFKNRLIGTDQGDVQLFSDFDSDGEMWFGEGSRTSRTKVMFSEPFQEAPVVHVGLSMWDMSHATNARVDLTVEEITPEGFTIVFQTWGDTQIARVRSNWIAFGNLLDEEEWELY